MFELWARKRAINGRGFPFEWIRNFDNEENKFYMSDTLDREVYSECMVIEEFTGILVFYREFDMPRKLTRKRK